MQYVMYTISSLRAAHVVDWRKRCERWKEKFSKVNTVQLLFYQR